MNNYPQWWNTTITVYNKFEDPLTQIIKWYSTVLDNCFWKYTGDKITIGQTVLETNNTICRIPINEKFLEPYQWRAKPNDEMPNFFTLGVGDIIVKGEVTEQIDEYVSGKRSSNFLSKYKELQGCIEIQEVAINIGGGRNEEHYFVKGV